MFDIGFWELALIGVVALLVVGPEKMPGLIRTAGQWAGQVQRLARDLRREIELEAHTEEYRALNQQFRDEDRKLKEMARNPLAAISNPATGDQDHVRSSDPGAAPGSRQEAIAAAAAAATGSDDSAPADTAQDSAGKPG